MKDFIKYRTFRNSLKLLWAIMIVALVSSCTDKFEEYNRNPGEPTVEDLMEGHYLIKLQFPTLVNYAFPVQENSYQLTENFIGGVYGRYFNISNSTWRNHFQTFNAQDSWLYTPIEDGYKYIARSFYEVEKLAEGKEEYQHLYNFARILKVTGFQRLTDMYGPLPYSKLSAGNLMVQYDDQETLYNTMFNELEEAIAVLTQHYKDNPNYQGESDIFDAIYGNDYKKWVVYANTLKLRMAMRIRFVNPELAKEKAESAVNHEFGVMVSNADNAYNSFNPNGLFKVAVDWKDSRACADIISYMRGYEDPRLQKYFTPAETGSWREEDYVGIRSGITIASQDISRKYSTARINVDDKNLIMPAAEAYFLRAEGAILGWNMGGTAQSLYEKGILTSFEQWGVGEDYVYSYIYDSKSTPADYPQPTSALLIDPKVNYAVKNQSTALIKWDENADLDKKLEKIITQKWIAIFPNGQEAWSEHRRTGYPKFFPVLVDLSGDPLLKDGVASRIPYPTIEKNKPSYSNVLELLGGEDKYSTKLWWDKKSNKK